MIYLIGAMPGMRKSTIMSPSFRLENPLENYYSTDDIRAATSNLLSSMGQNPQKVRLHDLPTYGEGEDGPAWVGTVGLIQYLHRNKTDAIIEGIAIKPEGVAKLKDQNSHLEIRAVFIGYSDIMEFQKPVWTPELENLFKNTVGEDKLDSAKNRDWMYKDENGKMKLYDELDRSIREFEDPAKTWARSNFKYLNLVDFIPPERKNGDIKKLQLEDHLRAAKEVRSFLLQ